MVSGASCCNLYTLSVLNRVDNVLHDLIGVMRAVEFAEGLHLVGENVVVDLLLGCVLVLQLVHFLELLVLLSVMHGFDPLSLAEIEITEERVDAGLVVNEFTVELSR